MDSAAIALVLATLGVNFGWQPTTEGPDGYEYTVQVEPEIARLLERGESVPIESEVPPDVAPIRKVRIVVGRGELPREARAGASERLQAYAKRESNPGRTGRESEKSPSEDSTPIVRGQSPDDLGENGSVRHTSAFAGAGVDRYGNPIGGGVAPPPGFVDRVNNGITETANALGDGLERGFADANAKLNQAGQQLWQGAQNATQSAAQQFQVSGDQARSATQQTVSAANSQAARMGESLGIGGAQGSPSWAPNVGPISATPIAGGAPVRTSTGWTTIGGNIAAPPVLPPSLGAAGASGNTLSNGEPRIAMNQSGPNLPLGSSSNRQPLNNMQTDATASTSSGSGSNMIPIRPVAPSVPIQQQSNSTWSDPWGTDPWSKSGSQLPAENMNQANSAPGNSGGTIGSPSSVSPDWSTNGSGTLSANGGGGDFQVRAPELPAATNSSGTVPMHVANPTGQFANIQAPPSANLSVAPGAAPSTNEVPWKPLLFTGIGLVGSLSANFFLGWSYMDARQRYALLARKTANSFRRRAELD